jgi:hypothetical protein
MWTKSSKLGEGLKLRRRSDNNHLIGCGKEPGLLDLHPTNKRKHKGEK